MFKKFSFLLFLGVGIFLLVQVIMPLLFYKVWEYTFYQQNIALVTPDPQGTILGISIKSINSFPAIISNNQRSTLAPYSQFSISIPSIKLNKAEVKVDSNIFDENLGHLPNSALPGERGNVFITGHSSLPQFYRLDNYKAIFSNLPQIKKGDLITVNAGGQIFNYSVIGLQIVNPNSTGVINPPDNHGRYLSLMTCVPPGLYLKRLIVLAELK